MILVHKKICSLHVLLLFMEGFITVISVNEGNVPCSYEIYADKKLQFLKKVWSIETENFKIYYTLCGTLPYIFGNNTAASFLDKNLGAHKEFYTNIGTGFVINHEAVEPGLTMTSVNGTKCQYSTNKDYSININFQCSDDMDEQPLLVSSDDKCTFNITMMHPQCTPKCTFRFLNNFIDLRPLNGTHFVKAKDKSFALSLCAPAPECGADKGLSVCETNTRAIAKHNSLNVGYRNHKESLFLTGDVTHPVNQKKEVIFKLMFKCNWETPGKQLRYIEKSVQGSHYDFEIESSVGCFVQHASCELIDGHFLYNLSNLYNLHQDKWIVKNYHRELWLNICGPLHLTDSMASKCTNTKAQVCENDNGIFTNKGTQLSTLELKDDIIRATIENGMVCNGTKNYRTLIDFFCDKNEYGPVFDKINECDTFIKWRTPQACPQFNVTRCKKEHNLIQANCTITVGEDIYDLSPLTLPNNKSHIIKNGKREFLINICQGIQEEDAPCSNDIFVAMRNTEQANNKYRITALGKKDRIDVTDTGTIVMQYKYGPICNDIFDEYSSEIHLVCSDIEEDPILIEQTQCSFKFSWKTIHACPVSELRQKKAVEECSLTDLSTSKTIKFEHIHSSMRIKNHDTSYDFDICHNNFSMCTGGIVENCSYLPYESRVIQFPYLKMSLPKNCDSPDDFNKTEILLECDRFINNSHFTSPEISNCTFRFKYVTDRVCGPIAPLTTTSSPMKKLVENIAKENQNHIMVTSTTTTSPRYRHAKFKGMELISDCSIINNITGYQYSLSKLGLNFTSICPYVTTISNKSMSLELQYQTEIRCKIRSDKHQSTYNIKILLQCSNGGLSTQAKESFPDLCIDKYSYSKLEFCNFFNPFAVGKRKSMEEVKGISIAGIIGIVIATTVVLILITFGITKYAKGKSKPQYCSVYYKNAGV